MPTAEDQQDKAPIASLIIPSLADNEYQSASPQQDEGEPAALTESAAVEAIQELSLSSESPSKVPAVFDPQPTVMSRGDSSISSLEDIGGSPKFSAANSNHPLQEDGAFVIPRRTSSQDSTNEEGQIVLTANQQQRLSSRNLRKDIAAESNTNNNNNSSPHSSSKSQQGGGRRSRSVSPTPAPVRALLAPISGALGWIQKQREKQNQRHLKELAEEQMRKLQRAQKSETSVNFTVVVPEDDEESEYGGGCFGEPHPQPEPQQQQQDQQEDSQRTLEDEDDISWIPPVRWVEEQVKKDVPPSPRSSGSNGNMLLNPTKPVPFLLTPEQMHDIAKYVLPKGIAFCRWKRLYSLTRDGDSFFQCMRLSGSEPKSLMVIKTTRGAIFGGYADAPWEVYSHQTGNFHGSAQACLFSFAISNNDDTCEPTNNNNAPPIISTATNLRVFHWTGANRYIQFTDTSESKRMLAFGGGGREGAFGLCVEQDFQLGSTGPCDTFGNVPLCDQENFHILDLEIWGFLTGEF